MPIYLAVLAREVTKTLQGKLGSGFLRINSSDKFSGKESYCICLSKSFNGFHCWNKLCVVLIEICALLIHGLTAQLDRLRGLGCL